jgi:hypothetical protein
MVLSKKLERPKARAKENRDEFHIEYNLNTEVKRDQTIVLVLM